MAIRCVNCGNGVDRDASGATPTRCPFCGFTMPVPKAAPPPAAPPPPVDDDPFGVKAAEAEKRAPKKKKKKGPQKLELDDDDAGIIVRTTKTPGKKWTDLDFIPYLAVGVVLFLIFMIYLFSTGGSKSKNAQAKKPSDVKEGKSFDVPVANFQFQAPSATWLVDDRRRPGEKLSVAIKRINPDGWFAITNQRGFSAVPKLEQLADDVVATWKSDQPTFEADKPEDVTLAKQPARKVGGVATEAGGKIRYEAIVMFYQGIAYKLIWHAAESDFPALAPEFADAVSRFSLGGERPGWEADMKGLAAVFQSKKYPYAVEAPKGRWKETPEMPTDSRFDDLKLLDSNRDGQIAVAPRPGTDIAAVKEKYLTLKKKKYQKVEMMSEAEPTQAGELTGERVRFTITDEGGAFFTVTAFLPAEGWVFQIECQSPPDKRATYEPAFLQIIESFRLTGAMPPAKPEDSSSEDPDEAPVTIVNPKAPVEVLGDKRPKPGAPKKPGDVPDAILESRPKKK